MQVSIEAPNKLERRLTVTVPVENVEEAYNQRIDNLSKTIKEKGFRQGKVPVEYIKQRYGDSVRQEALSEVIQKFLYQAINQEKLTPVSVPQVEPKSIAPGQPVEFVATFEIFPEVESVSLELLQIENPIVTVTEEDVDFVIQSLCKQHTQWNKVDRAAQNNDQVVLDFKGTIEGVPIKGGEAKNYAIVLGSHAMVPGFEEGVLGLLAGEQKMIALKFPDNYFSQEHAGKAAEFQITLNKVFEPVVPEVNEEFIKKMGVKSATVADFRAEIHKNLEREIKRKIKEKAKKYVFDQLVEQNPIDVPMALIQREAKRIHDELHPHHANQPDHHHSEAENIALDQSAKRNIILGVLVARLLKQHAIVLDSARVKGQIEQLAAVYENPEETIRWYETNKKAKKEIEMLMLEEQLVEKLLENVQATEVKTNYREFMAHQGQRN